MKKLALIFALIITISSNGYAEKTITLDIGEWAPYTSKKDPEGKIAETLVTESFKLVNIDVVYKYYPWKRAYMHAKEGGSSGTFPWYRNEDRLNDFIVCNEPILVGKVTFFHLKSFDFQWKTLENVKKYKIGGVIGYAVVEIFKDNGIKVEEVPNGELNYRKLLAGRIDAVAEDFFVGYNTINKLFKPEIAALFTHHPKPQEQRDMFMLISKQIPNGQELADKFDKGLKKLKASGRYDEIIVEFLGIK